MGAVGIVAEYNPFHPGHLAHIDAVRAALGEDVPVAAVLSGNFVQRGEAACFSKFARAEAAVRCGVSLVLELPAPWCLSSAEGFARGAVGILAATGVVDCISFGSESADARALLRCAEVLDSDAFHDALRAQLAGGRSFAAARSRAAASLAGKEPASVLTSPNDLLGVEYIRAGAAVGYRGDYLPIKRLGPGHDGPGSAAYIREKMTAGEAWMAMLPARAAEVFQAECASGRGPVTAEKLRLPILSRLRMLREEDFARLPDAAEGLDHRLYAAVRNAASPQEAAMAAKSRRYALSRLRRMVMCAALGITRGDAEGTPPYIRVLAMDEKGRELLRKMRKTAALPVIVKPAGVRKMSDEIQRIFALTAMAHDLFALGYERQEDQRAGEDWRFSPHVLQSTSVFTEKTASF